jgi:hypothetical protein
MMEIQNLKSQQTLRFQIQKLQTQINDRDNLLECLYKENACLLRLKEDVYPAEDTRTTKRLLALEDENILLRNEVQRLRTDLADILMGTDQIDFEMQCIQMSEKLDSAKREAVNIRTQLFQDIQKLKDLTIL